MELTTFLLAGKMAITPNADQPKSEIFETLDNTSPQTELVMMETSIATSDILSNVPSSDMPVVDLTGGEQGVHFYDALDASKENNPEEPSEKKIE